MVALDLKTGAKRWQTVDFTDPAHYSSIIAAEIDGVRTYIQLTAAHVVGIAPKDGKVLWKVARKGDTAVITTPIYSEHEVYVTSGYGAGCNLFKILSNSGAFTAEQVYANKVMANHHGGVILVDDKLYGYSEAKGWVCQDFKTGKMVWSEKEKLKKGCVSFADGKLICREEDSGILALLEASPSGYVEKGRFPQPDRAKEKAWTPPTIANGHLLVRDQDVLFCYNLQGT
jgi:outer membrane protein assembly factor BamB